MFPKALAHTIDERLEMIEALIARIDQAGADSDLRDLRLLLLDTMGLLRRDPGIEAAAEDLYAAAAAFVSDRTANASPIARKLRLFHSAHQRLKERLAGAAERVGPQERPRLQGLAALYATQFGLGSTLTGLSEPDLRLA
jgi:hypothetical protein